MPYAPAPACLEPRCPNRAVPGGRGRCEEHRQNTTERGYGTAHQRERRAALPGARCESCGCTDLSCLQRDHRVPVGLGGPEIASNKRWLCRSANHRCHDRIGLRRDRKAVA
jgi:hypothetical protein